MMKDYITLIGADNYYGTKIFFVGQKVKLIKDFENMYDEEAIRVEVETLNTVGYVANSVHTVAKGTKSAGRIYDTFKDEISGTVKFIVKDVAIVEIDNVSKDDDLDSLFINRSKVEKISIIDMSVFNKDFTD